PVQVKGRQPGDDDLHDDRVHDYFVQRDDGLVHGLAGPPSYLDAIHDLVVLLAILAACEYDACESGQRPRHEGARECGGGRARARPALAAVHDRKVLLDALPVVAPVVLLQGDLQEFVRAEAGELHQHDRLVRGRVEVLARPGQLQIRPGQLRNALDVVDGLLVRVVGEEVVVALARWRVTDRVPLLGQVPGADDLGRVAGDDNRVV